MALNIKRNVAPPVASGPRLDPDLIEAMREAWQDGTAFEVEAEDLVPVFDGTEEQRYSKAATLVRAAAVVLGCKTRVRRADGKDSTRALYVTAEDLAGPAGVVYE